MSQKMLKLQYSQTEEERQPSRKRINQTTFYYGYFISETHQIRASQPIFTCSKQQ